MEGKESGLGAGVNGAGQRAVIGADVGDTDADLARRAAAGDAAAFAVLYDRYVAPVYRYAFLRVRDRMEAEDVTSDVFFRALGALHRYEPRSAFLAWLFRIARNAVIDRSRRRRTVPLASHDASREGSEQVLDPAAIGMARAEADELRAALGRLSELQRDVIVMRFFADLSTEEIGAALGKGPSTVRGIQHRALAALRSILAPEERT